MSARIKVNISELGRVGTRVQKFLRNLADKDTLLDSLGVALVSQVGQRFEEGKGPDGEEWPVAERGGQTLVDSGRLRDSITHEVDGASVKVGTNVIYATTHQFGATIKPKRAKVLAFTIKGQVILASEVTIPARPFLGIDDDSITIIRGEIADFVTQAKREARG